MELLQAIADARWAVPLTHFHFVLFYGLSHDLLDAVVANIGQPLIIIDEGSEDVQKGLPVLLLAT